MEKALRYALGCGLVLVFGLAMLSGGLAAGFFAARALPENVSVPGLPDAGQAEQNEATPDELRLTFEPFWEAWDLVHAQYVDQPVDDTLLMQGAIRGMVEALGDQHSRYMSPAEFEIASTDQSGEFEGIGAYVQGEGDFLRIVSPFPGSPAEAAGLLPGDLIIRVDGEDIAGIGESEIIRRVRGPAGSTVVLTVQREGVDEPLEFSIVRQKFDMPSVESEMLEGKVAYVKINEFGAKTTAQLREQLGSLMAQKPVGVVLDLRNNPGGYLETAIEVVSEFIPDGTVMLERFGDGREKVYAAQAGGQATGIPLVVLINQGSASASEIVAGAIQDRGRGQIVGETSFGKGSVQIWNDLGQDNGAVAITIARWLTPNGNSIHEQGITPDVVVEITDEDRAAERDPQLDKALELLK